MGRDALGRAIVGVLVKRLVAASGECPPHHLRVPEPHPWPTALRFVHALLVYLLFFFLSEFPRQEVAQEVARGGDVDAKGREPFVSSVSKMTPTEALVELMVLPMTATTTTLNRGVAGAGGIGEQHIRKSALKPAEGGQVCGGDGTMVVLAVVVMVEAVRKRRRLLLCQRPTGKELGRASQNYFPLFLGLLLP